MPLDFNPKSKASLLFGAAIAAMVTVRCIWLWQPERQVELHQQHFIEAVSDRKWKKIDHFLAEDFRDRFDHDKAWALKESREVLRQFFALTVKENRTNLALATPGRQEATVTSTLKIEGGGTPIAEYAKTTVNSSTKPFTFTWKQKSWKPWDWQLTSIDHPLMARGREDY
jgi:hypothetical protein